MSEDGQRLPFSPWWLVAAAALAIGAGGTYQFLWSSIRGPLSLRAGTSEAAIGTMFTVFVVFQTGAQFPAGWVRDRVGPRIPMAAATVFLAAGFAGVALARSYPLLLASYGVGGVGAGAAYTVAVNTPVKWFRARRGLATGVVVMSFGGVSFLLIPFVRAWIRPSFPAVLLGLAVLAGLGGLVAAIVLRDPAGEDEESADEEAGEDAAARWRDAVGTWQFWLLYVVFAANNLVGLMLIGKVVSYAETLELTALAATGSASLIAVAEAGGSLVGGAAADRVGARVTLVSSMVLGGLSLLGAVAAGELGFGLAFVALAAATAFLRSPIFTVYPALVGEYYGTAYVSETYALLYTGKLWGGLGAGALASLSVSLVGWSTTFLAGGIVLIATGLLVLALEPVGAESDGNPAR